MASIGQKTIDQLAESVGDKECETDLAQLLGVKYAFVHDRFLCHGKGQPADIKKSVSENQAEENCSTFPVVHALDLPRIVEERLILACLDEIQ